MGRRKLSKSDNSKGGSKTKLDAIKRQQKVEQLMKSGYSETQIAAGNTKDGKSLGTPATIRKDVNEIRSRWLEADPDWFHRARIARIEAVERLKPQLIRLNKLILEITKGDYDNKITSTKEGGAFVAESNGDRPKKLTYAESQLTAVIKAIYEIDADFDPEQYLDKKIQESIEHKVQEATPAIS